MGNRGKQATSAVVKTGAGLAEGVIGAKAIVASGGLLTVAGVAAITDGSSRMSGGINDYTNIFQSSDNQYANGDYVETGMQELVGNKQMGSTVRDSLSMILTMGTNILFQEQQAAAQLSKLQRPSKNDINKPGPKKENVQKNSFQQGKEGYQKNVDPNTLKANSNKQFLKQKSYDNIKTEGISQDVIANKDGIIYNGTHKARVGIDINQSVNVKVGNLPMKPSPTPIKELPIKDVP